MLQFMVGIGACWLMGSLGLGSAWPLIIATFCLAIDKASLGRLYHSQRLFHLRAAYEKISSESSDSVWLNEIIKLGWAKFSPALSMWVADSLQPTLDWYKPSTVKALELTKLELGTKAPSLTSMRVSRGKGTTLVLDTDLNFRSNCKLVLAIRLALGSAPIAASDLELKGCLRITVDFIHRWPWAGNLGIAFTEKPDADIVIRPLRGLDIMDVPGLSSWLNNLLTGSVLESLMVLPVRIDLPFDEWFNTPGGFGSGQALPAPPKGPVRESSGSSDGELLGMLEGTGAQGLGMALGGSRSGGCGVEHIPIIDETHGTGSPAQQVGVVSLTVAGARNLSSGGGILSLAGNVDPYCVVSIENSGSLFGSGKKKGKEDSEENPEIARSSTQSNTTSPAFNLTTKVPVKSEQSDVVVVSIMDARLGKDRLLGAAMINVRDVAFGIPVERWFKLQGGEGEVQIAARYSSLVE